MRSEKWEAHISVLRLYGRWSFTSMWDLYAHDISLQRRFLGVPAPSVLSLHNTLLSWPLYCCVLYPGRAPSPLAWIHRVYPLVALPHLLTSPYLPWMSFWFRAKAFAPCSEGAPSGRGWLSHSASWQPVGLLLSNDMPPFTPHLVWCLCFLISFLSLGNRTAPQYSYKRRPQVATDVFQVWNYCVFSLFPPLRLNVIPETALEGLVEYWPYRGDSILEASFLSHKTARETKRSQFSTTLHGQAHIPLFDRCLGSVSFLMGQTWWCLPGLWCAIRHDRKIDVMMWLLQPE